TMVVTNSQGVLLSGGSIATTSTEDAEETAIALALTLPNATTIISDSKRAVQNYARGRISRFAARILRDFVPTDTVSIVWAPAHSSLPGNDFAHNTARELAYRAAGDRESGLTLPKDVLTTYQEITQAYRLARKRYPAGAQEHTWRRLQTNTSPSRSPFFRDVYQDLIEVMKPLASAIDVLQKDDHMCMGYLLPTITSDYRATIDHALILHFGHGHHGHFLDPTSYKAAIKSVKKRVDALEFGRGQEADTGFIVEETSGRGRRRPPRPCSATTRSLRTVS
ncbi:hypothetical protein HPB47_018270, partial [Ixodes persulcatus]